MLNALVLLLAFLMAIMPAKAQLSSPPVTSTITIGPAPPAVALTAPTAGTYSGSINVTGTCSPSCTDVKLQIRASGQPVGSASTIPSGECTTAPVNTCGPVSYNTTAVADGNYLFNAVGTNSAGTATSSDVAVTIQNGASPTGPVITSVAVRVIGSVAANTNVPITVVNSAATGTGGTVTTSGLIATNSSSSLNSCAITGDSRGVNTTLFAISTSGTNCLLKTAGSALSGAGYAYLPITATDGSGHVSKVTMISVEWRTNSTGGLLNVISGTISVVTPASNPATSWAAGQIIGRAGTDNTPGAAYPSSCTITSGDTTHFQVTTTSGGKFFCVIQAKTGMATANGSATLTITATNTNGTGTAGTVTVNWATVPSGAPVVSQAAFSATLPAGGLAANTLLGTVSATNTPTSCAIDPNSDPGAPTAWFKVTAVSTGCQISTNTVLSGNLGSPILFVTASNSFGTSLGNYVIVALGPNSACTDSTAACTAAKNTGYTNLIVNSNPFTASQLDWTDSQTAGFYWYRIISSLSNQFLCEQLLGCRGAGNPGVFDWRQDQDGDPTPTVWPTLSGGFMTMPDSTNAAITTGSGFSSIGQFGVVPYNMQFPVIGQAFGGKGYYLDYASTADGTTRSGGSSFYGMQFYGNGFIPPPPNKMIEIDWPQNGQFAPSHNGFDICSSTYNHQPYCDAPAASELGGVGYVSGLHHYQTLIIPASQNPNNDGGATGVIRTFYDGTETTGSPFNYTPGANITTGGYNVSLAFGLDSQYSWIGCCSGQPSNGSITHSIQVWAHP